MSDISDILAFAAPLAANDPKVLAKDRLRATNEHAFAVAKCRPDDKETLVEEQEYWLKKWSEVLVS